MDFSSIIPVALVTLGLLGVIIADLLGKGQKPIVPQAIAVLALLAGALSALGLEQSNDTVLGVLRPDAFTVIFTVFFCVVGAMTIIATTRGEAFRSPGGEFLSMILASVIGMAVLTMSVDLICLYLAFETVSIPSYVLVGMRRADPKANESSLKYVLFGAVSSALMLYGLSFIVGLSGGTSLDAVAAAVQNGAGSQPIFVVACLLVFAGFAYKISAVPFHFWAPDVYAGAPASVGGFLAVASKAAGFAALVRVVAAMTPEGVGDAADPMGQLLPEANALIVIIAVSAIITMTFGNLAALKQREIKRLLAWSSIAHAGYIMLAVTVWSPYALQALIFYLIAYLFMNIAAFFIAGIAIREMGTGELRSFRGLMTSNPGLAVFMAIILFSLTGLPPFFGFIAKYHVFYAVFEKGYIWLGVIGLVNGVISLYYYARVVAYMFLDELEEGEAPPSIRMSLVDKVFCAVTVIPLVPLGLFWAPIWEWAQASIPAVLGL
ncbi:MAG: NADH-quinone oxidoreductase subunit N [Planctomycetota bacterium]|nr:NADH-quinone oxidoreductase subunit N [Planctomycetota bacterium]